MYRIECSAISYIGLVRSKNEDNYYINGKYKTDIAIDTEGYIDNAPRHAYLYAVCDGMGGEKFGELASLLAVKSLANFQETDIRQTLKEYIHTANDLICKEIIKNNGVRIGTTLALLYICEGYALSCNIGDSRVYLLRNEDLYLMTEDHTEAQRLVEMGMLNQDDVSNHKSRNKLTQHLGIFPDEMVIEPFAANPLMVEDNDMFLLCSDGLTDMLEDKAIEEIMRQNSTPQDITEKLITTAMQNGGKDNVTVIVVTAKIK